MCQPPQSIQHTGHRASWEKIQTPTLEFVTHPSLRPTRRGLFELLVYPTLESLANSPLRMPWPWPGLSSAEVTDGMVRTDTLLLQRLDNSTQDGTAGRCDPRFQSGFTHNLLRGLLGLQ